MSRPNLEISTVVGCSMRCCPVGSPVLMGDMTLRPVESVAPGDIVMGFERGTSSEARNFWWRPSRVLEVSSREAPVVEYRLSDGSKLQCTPDHLWFAGARYSSRLHRHAAAGSAGDPNRTTNGFCDYIYPRLRRQLVRLHGKVPVIDFASKNFKLGYVHGALDGEGTPVHRKGKSQRWRFFVTEESFYLRVLQFSKDIIGDVQIAECEWIRIDGKIKRRSRGSLAGKTRQPGEGYCLTLGVEAFKAIGPTRQFRCNDYVAGWLSGMVDAEGTFASNGLSIAQYESANAPTHRRIQEALLHFSIRPLKRGDTGWIVARDRSLVELALILNLALSRKLPRPLEGKSIYRRKGRVKIVGTLQLGTMRVYSCKTETGNYVSQGVLSSNCSYCPQTLHIRKYAETNDRPDFTLSLDNFHRCLASVPLDVEILFAGMAEPWLNPHTTAMVLQAHAAGRRVGVYTTTVGLPPSDIPLLAAIPFLHFCIHLPDAEGRMKLKVDANYLAGLAAARAIPGHNFTCIGTLHPAVREVLGRDLADDTPGLLSRASNLPERAIPRKTGPLRCSATAPGKLDHNVLLPNGDVVLCCCDYSQAHVLGNLLRGTYADLCTSPVYQEVQRGLAGDESVPLICRTCELSVAP